MVELRSKRLSLQPALDFVFGFDFFISYSHADGQNYPKHLQERLEQVGFKVFLDVSEYAPGMDLPRETVRQVKKSRKLLVVARRAALASEWVKREIEVALSQGKLPIIVNINSAIEQTASTSFISKIAIEREWFTLNERLEDLDGFPSDDAVTALVRGFKNARQGTKRLRAFAAATAVLTITTAIAVWQGFAAVKNQRLAVENAKQAEANAKPAEANEREATNERYIAISQRNAALNGRGRLFAAVASQYNEKGDFGTALSVALAGISEAQKSDSPVPSQLQLGLFVAQNELRERATFQGLATVYYNSAPALSPDGKLLAACAQNALVVWDVRSKVIVGNVPDEPDDAGICNAAFSPDGKTVVFGEHVKTSSVAGAFRIRAFNTTLTSTQFDVANNDDALAIAFTPNGQYLVAFERERTYFLDPSSGRTLWSTPRETPPGSTIWRDEYEMSKPGALSSDSTLMVRIVGARVDIWDVAAKQKATSLDNMVPVTTVAISPDHARIITASFDGIARVWDIDTKREMFGLAGHTAGIISVAYSPDGSLILTCSKDGTARLWDAQSGTPLATLWGRRSPSAAVIFGSFSPDGRSVVTLNTEGDITFWDASPAMASADWADADIRAYASFNRDERTIPVSISHKVALTEPAWPRHIDIAMVDVQTGKKIATAPFVISKSDGISVREIQVCQRDNRVLIDLGPRWQVRDATLANVEAEAEKDRYRKVLFSPDCKSIVTSVWNRDTHLFSVIRIVSSMDGRDIVHRTLDKDYLDTISSLEFSV